MVNPPKVTNIEDYWTAAPPEPSPRLTWWLQRLSQGFRPNGRISSMGYYEAAEFFGVYLWEYLNVLGPAMRDPSPQVGA